MFDTIVADLLCPGCGATGPAEIQTYLRSEAETFRIGDVFDPSELTPERLAGCGYAQIGAATDHIAILDYWICRSCSSEQWARVTFENAVLARVEAVFLASAFQHSHYIREQQAEYVAKPFAGESTVAALHRQLATEVPREYRVYVVIRAGTVAALARALGQLVPRVTEYNGTYQWRAAGMEIEFEVTGGANADGTLEYLATSGWLECPHHEAVQRCEHLAYILRENAIRFSLELRNDETDEEVLTLGIEYRDLR